MWAAAGGKGVCLKSAPNTAWQLCSQANLQAELEAALESASAKEEELQARPVLLPLVSESSHVHLAAVGPS